MLNRRDMSRTLAKSPGSFKVSDVNGSREQIVAQIEDKDRGSSLAIFYFFPQFSIFNLHPLRISSYVSCPYSRLKR